MAAVTGTEQGGQAAAPARRGRRPRRAPGLRRGFALWRWIVLLVAAAYFLIPLYAAFRFAGAGTVTDLLVHDNTIGASIPVYSMAPGLSFGTNVRFSRNIIVGGAAAGLGVTPVTLPPSGTAFTNPGPYSEVVYIQGGKLLTGTGATQGVVKNGHVLVPGSVVLKTPVSVVLDPGESLTVYYSVVPTAWKDVKG